MQTTMMQMPLSLNMLLERARRPYGNVEVITRRTGRCIARLTAPCTSARGDSRRRWSRPA
jgi:hypothetical protein